MDDLISRQAAIDALEKIPVREFKITDDGLLDALISIGQVFRALKQLPSAQPELPIKQKCIICPHCDNCDANDDGTMSQPEIIRCVDCRWWGKEFGWNGAEYTVCARSTINRPIRNYYDFCSRAERREE